MAEIKEITPLFLTAKGLKLQAKVQAGLTKLEITKAVIGYGYLDDSTDKEQMTGLIHEIASHATGGKGSGAAVDITRLYNDEGTGVAMVSVEVSNGDNEYTYLREFGFMATDPDNGEILYGVANLGDSALPLPTYDGKAHVVYECDFPTIISNSDNITVNITKPAEVKRAEFDKHRTKEVIDHPDKSVTSEKLAESIVLRGKPTAPTAGIQTNDAQIATTAFVQAAVAALGSIIPYTVYTNNTLSQIIKDIEVLYVNNSSAGPAGTAGVCLNFCTESMFYTQVFFSERDIYLRYTTYPGFTEWKGVFETINGLEERIKALEATLNATAKTISNLDDAEAPGLYYCLNVTGTPNNEDGILVTEISRRDTSGYNRHEYKQTFISVANNKHWTRTKSYGQDWTSWQD